MSDADSDDLDQWAARTPVIQTGEQPEMNWEDEEEMMNGLEADVEVPQAGPSQKAPALPAAARPPSMPSLGVGGDSWDDRELINAWESAAEEFQLHNPGPGSWLDKATAALAVGNPLAGATKATASKWYTSTPSHTGNSNDTPTQDKGKSTSATKKNNKKRKQPEVNGAQAAPSGGAARDNGNGYGRGEMVGANPYAQVGRVKRARITSPSNSEEIMVNRNMEPRSNREASPAFTPGSPGAYSPSQPVAGPSRTNGSQHHERARQFEGSDNGFMAAGSRQHYPATDTGIYPPIGAASGVGRMGGNMVTREEASVRAVNAQWWAGYWFAMSELLPTADEMT